MAKEKILLDDRIEQIDETIKVQFEENIKSVVDDLRPVDAIRLLDDKIGIVNNNNDIIPIGGQDTNGTINQEGQLIIALSANDTGNTIIVNGENIFKSAPTKLSYTLSEVLKAGQIIIGCQKGDLQAPEGYRISVVQNPNFDDATFSDYTPIIKNIDGEFTVEPDVKKRVFTKTPPYIFKIETFANGNLLNSDITLDSQSIKELNFTFPQGFEKRIPDTPAPPTSILTINLTGLSRAVNLKRINFDSTLKPLDVVDDNLLLNSGNTPIIVENGEEFELSTSNLNLYRITSVQFIPENGKSAPLEAQEGESLIYRFKVETNSALNIVVEEIVQTTTNIPSIELVSSDKFLKYNINSKSDLPIVVRAVNGVNTITAFIKDKTYTFTPKTELNRETVVVIPSIVFDTIGNYKVSLVASNVDTESKPLELTINVVDEVFIGVPDITNIVYPRNIEGADYAGTNVDFQILYETVDTDFLRVHINDSPGYFQVAAKGPLDLNFQKLLEYINYQASANEREINLFLKLVPYNISGDEEIKGKEEIINISFSKSNLEIPRNVAINRIAEGFLNQLDDSIFSKETSKYLTHLLHVDGENKVITTWLGDRGTIIYKLYEPLDTAIEVNQEVWISKLISTPIIETITIVGEEVDVCNQLKGPNFSLEPDNGISYLIYDELVASGSITSEKLITQYLDKQNIDTSQLVVSYITGSEYAFDKFVNFSSAAERVNNFYYKIKLLENYEIQKSNLQIDFNITETNSLNKIQNNARELIANFDGFERFLYYTTNLDSNGLAYPKTNPSSSILLNTSSSIVETWAYNISSKAAEFDKYNPNLLKNNIPEFLRESGENADFVLFCDMLGQHFDVLWLYIKSLAEKNNLTHEINKGISNNIISNMLESLGWKPKRAFDSQFLWEYVFGTYSDGQQKYSKSLKSANEEVWRRILNNLPYILKHKGTGRAMKAVMACYGVPQSMLTIMEFGGPQDPSKGNNTKFTFDDRTAAYYLSGSSTIKVPWVSSSLTTDYPNCIEIRIKPDKLPNTKYTILSGSEWTLDLVQTTGSFGKLEFNFGGNDALSPYIEEPFISASVSTYYFTPGLTYVYGPDLKTGSLEFPISTEYYSNIAVNRYNYAGSSSLFEIWFATSDGQRITTSVSASILYNDTQWSSGSYLHIGGNGYQGNIDEFRLWTAPLQRSKFENHTLFPDAINGNHISASTTDLLFRLDFEYPKDRNIDPYIKNVAINQSYGHSSATASVAYNAPTYPYQYTPYDRTVTAVVPSTGFGYANKIRFETQTLQTDLSYKARATKKSFDQAPIDSSRLGLFFSPIKELNMDILKTFGDFNIDNYIGDPSDEYKDTYSKLDKLREYYFERYINSESGRNIYEYIQMVKYIDKSLFDVLADLAPARAKISKGLLIEPHFLERSKTRWDKPKSERGDHETSISMNDTNQIELSYDVKEAELNEQNLTKLIGDLPSYTSEINGEEIYTLIGTNPNYDGEIDYDFNNLLESTAPFYDTYIQAIETGSIAITEVNVFSSTQIGMDKNSLENIGFGLYAKSGSAIIRSWDGIFGNNETTGSRRKVFLVKEQKTKKISTQVSGWPTNGSQPGDRVKYENVATNFINYRVSLQPYNGSVTTGNEVIEVTPVNGYLPTHYRYKFLPEGLKRSYFKGSKQTATTTPDGLSPVEIFTTNPNILRVSKTGRGGGEPILEVD
jgi:hypothetical protein